jgi:uracil-DNA glycosylase
MTFFSTGNMASAATPASVVPAPMLRPKISIGKPNFATMSLYELSTYTTDFSWRSLFMTAKPELDHIQKMLHKAQCEALEAPLPEESWFYYPPRQQIFRAFQYTPFNAVKVIIIAMDPYPGRNSDGTPQACGLAFSCEHSVPDSVRNIFQEIKRTDSSFVAPPTANLIKWAQQGVLLLNGALTFLPIGDGAEQKRQQGLWEQLVHRVIGEITALHKGLAICIWGRDAQRYEKYVNGSHLLLTASHPSPRSFAMTDQPFKGCGHFQLINSHLEKQGKTPIDWQLV